MHYSFVAIVAGFPFASLQAIQPETRSQTHISLAGDRRKCVPFCRWPSFSTKRSSFFAGRSFRVPSAVTRDIRQGCFSIKAENELDVEASVVPVSDEERATLKTDFLLATAGTNRGLLTSPESRTFIDSLIQRLEDVNPTPMPAEKVFLFQGTWRLVYTNSLDVVLLGRIPGVQLGEVYQKIDRLTLENQAEVAGLPPFDKYGGNSAFFTVEASLEVVSPVRLQVTFERAQFKVERFFGQKLNFLPTLQAPIRSVSSGSTNYLDTTYIDDDFRIGRGLGSSVFVLVRVKDGVSIASDWRRGGSVSTPEPPGPQEISID
eukprot:CAMPEP_0184648682 /NCGR_PEP_ID=MMETSP0308-20130426/5832_1 /TAXON_ID=38269 /ORGANISM="Gloeochaete witrockiana, Strain SAG 46.84" /LENGTH=317 /DNA_ID=CAMNT_0027080723 /DNA_START=79 /DNA_END=1032 /DNA_ORIENTATION=+